MRKVLVMVVLAATALAACSSSKSNASSTTTTAAAAPTSTTVPEKLRILVTNDDGVAAPGIDALVEALRALPDTSVTVIAPAKNQSGSGGKTTPGPLTATDAKTASGYPAKAVNGFPADTITYALDQGGLKVRPHVVLSGINQGQNLGTIIDISGTVGAARAAAQRGVPALATSQGLGDPPDFPSGVTATLAWLAKHRAALLARDTAATTGGTVTNLNTPTCPTGKPHPVVIVPVDTKANGIGDVNCVAAYPNPKTDVAAFLHGYVAETDNLALKPTG